MTIQGPPVGGRPSRVRQARPRRALVLLLLSAALVGAVPPVADATPEILRESYAPATWDNAFANVWANQPVAQSFLARTNFLLTHLDLYVFDQPGTTGPDILQVSVATDAGNQPGSILGGTGKQGSQNWSWASFGFYPWIPVTMGQRYWILAEDSEPRPKGYEWAMNDPGGYVSGEAQWYDLNVGRWINSTGADLFFRVYGISGPSMVVEAEPDLLLANPGTTVPLTFHFNNTGNEPAGTATIDVALPEGLMYVSDDAGLEGGVRSASSRWAFNDVDVGPHRLTVWVRVEPNAAYYDGQSLQTRAFLNYTDAAGALQAPSWDVTAVTVLVPVLRAEIVPVPAHVAPGETFNFTVSFFNVGSGAAATLWLNGSAGARLTVLGDDAAAAGGIPTGPSEWRFANITAQTYVFNVTARADSDAWPGDRLAFHADLTYTDGGGHPFATRTTEGTATVHGPSVEVEATTDHPRARPGDLVRVLLYANNTGDEVAARIWLNATLPTMAVLEDSQPVSGTRTGNLLAYEIGNLPPGGLALALRLRIASNATPADRVDVDANLVVANASGRILRPSTARAEAFVVTPRFALGVDLSRSVVGPGDPVDLVLRWNNTGNEGVRWLWLNLTLPENTILVNSSRPWTFTDGTTYGWEFPQAGIGEGFIRVRIEAGSRMGDGELAAGRVDLRYEREDGVLSGLTTSPIRLEGSLTGTAVLGLELLLLWIAILVAVFLLFLLLGYMDLLPHKRTIIDDVFLLHNSGILICHYSTTLRPDVDSDIASGMLMAVRNFVADTLRSKNGSLQELKYGDHRIHMVHGRHSILVTFTRGGNGKALEQRMQEVLRNIETAYESVLDAWSGRTEDFKGIEEHILRLIQM